MSVPCIHCKAPIELDYRACPRCGEPITDFLRQYLEHPIDGKYQILSRLGMGGMGEVYKVLHVHLNTIRVVKLMRPSIASEATAHERFLREARLATRIQHPNVATLHDFSTLPDGSHYMVWEFIEGTNLTQLVRERGSLSPRYTAWIAIEALRGLDAIHRAGIIHRDVSPDNIMISRDDDGEERVKIIDLGIAKSGGDSGEAQTQTGLFIGKWKYCSPEHLGLLPEGERIDGRADIYSFGIVMYELLSGTPPFVADTPQQYLVSHARTTPRPLRELNPIMGNAPELEALIFRALEKDRSNRFQTAREFARELETILPTLPDTPGAGPQAIPVPRQPTERSSGLRTTLPSTVAVPAGAAQPTIQTASPRSADATVREERARDDRTVVSPPAAAAEPPVAAQRKSSAIWLIAAIALLLGVGVIGAGIFVARNIWSGRNGKAPPPNVATTGRAAGGATPLPAPASSNEIVVTPPATAATETAAAAPEPAPAPPTGTASGPASGGWTLVRESVETGAVSKPAERRAPEKRVAEPEPEPRTEPQPETRPQAAPPPTGAPQGGRRSILGRFRRGSNRLVESAEYNGGSFQRGIIRNYDAMTSGGEVQWAYVAPGVQLSNYEVRVSGVRNLTSVRSNAESVLQNDLQEALNDLAEDLENSSGRLTADLAIYWAEADRSKKRGIGAEAIIRDGSGRVVATLRHAVRENSPEDAAEEVAEAIAEFIEEH